MALNRIRYAILNRDSFYNITIGTIVKLEYSHSDENIDGFYVYVIDTKESLYWCGVGFEEDFTFLPTTMYLKLMFEDL